MHGMGFVRWVGGAALLVNDVMALCEWSTKVDADMKYLLALIADAPPYPLKCAEDFA